MIFVTTILWIISVFLLILKFKEKINPLIFIFHYFYGMLFFSQLSLTGISKPTEIVVFYFLISYVAVLCGVLLSKKGRKNTDILKINNKSILYFILFLGVLPLSFVLYKNLFFIFSDYEVFVQNVRFERDTASVAGSAMMTSVIDRVVRPVSIFSAVIGISFYFITKKKTHLYIGCYLLIVFSILYVKRIDLMFLLVMFLGGIFSVKQVATNHSKKNTIKNYTYFILTIAVLFVISSFRAASYSAYHMFLHYGIGYHTYGFALFDHALNNPASHIHDWVIPGETIFATFDFFIDQVYKFLGLSHTPVSSYLYSEELGEHIFMGYNNFNGEDISPNAFYTSLYPAYRDMKHLGLVLLPFIYGYLFSRVYQSFRANTSVSTLVWVIYFTYIGYASLLTPVIMGNTFWIVPLLLLFFSKIVIISGNKNEY